MHTTRRNCLRLILGVSISALASPAVSVPSASDSRARVHLITSLANFFGDKESARVVGMEYLRSNPTEYDVELLVERVFSSHASRRAEFARAGKRARQALLGKQICEDFGHGRVVEVQGWMLSETEARLCAMTALV
jgi:hypothetical protein